MQFAFSPRTQFAALAVANAIAIGVTNAQGPAPSPLLPQAAPAPSKETVPPPQASPAPELTKADFETFLDALIPSQLRNRNIAGAVVSVVKDGQVLFQKGYGYADVEEKKQPLVAGVPCHWLGIDGRCGSFDYCRGSLCQAARTRALVSRSRNSFSGWRNRITECLHGNTIFSMRR